MEHEISGTIPRKQRDLNDFTVISAVEQMIRAIEETDGQGTSARDNRRVRYLSQMKFLNGN